MTKLLALTIGGDNGDAATTITVPAPLNGLVNDPKIISRIIGTGITLIIVLSCIAVLLFTLYQAYRWITSQGDKKEIETISGAFWHGILGLIIILVSYFIINLIGFFFQIDFFHFKLS